LSSAGTSEFAKDELMIDVMDGDCSLTQSFNNHVGIGSRLRELQADLSTTLFTSASDTTEKQLSFVPANVTSLTRSFDRHLDRHRWVEELNRSGLV
jgi:hypothetical protein